MRWQCGRRGGHLWMCKMNESWHVPPLPVVWQPPRRAFPAGAGSSLSCCRPRQKLTTLVSNVAVHTSRQPAQCNKGMRGMPMNIDFDIQCMRLCCKVQPEDWLGFGIRIQCSSASLSCCAIHVYSNAMLRGKIFSEACLELFFSMATLQLLRRDIMS